MTLTRLLTAASVAAMIGGAAMAQTTGADDNQLPSTSATGMPLQGYAQHSPGVTDPQVSPSTVTTPPASATVTTGVMDHSTMGANSATTAGANVSATAPTVTTTLTTNGPVPDTAENRARYGQPLSRAGKATTPAGN